MAESEGICFPSRRYGWIIGIDFDFLSDLFVFTSAAFVFWHRNLYHFFFHRCGWEIAISPDHCLVLLPLCCFFRSRESWASVVSATESCMVSGCLSHLNLAVAEGRIFCGSAIVAAKALNSLSL